MKSKKLKQMLSIVALTTIVGSSTVIAATNDVSDSGTYSTSVSYTKGSSFVVKLPTSLSFNNAGVGEYSVTASGDIPGYDYVSVIPDSEFTMKQLGKTDVTGSINQLKTVFNSDDLSANSGTGTTTTGTLNIDTSKLSAGTWQGAFNFYVNLTHNDAADVDLSVPSEVVEKLSGKRVYVVGDSLLAGNGGADSIPFSDYMDTYFGTLTRNYALGDLTILDSLAYLTTIDGNKMTMMNQLSLLKANISQMGVWADKESTETSVAKGFSKIADGNYKLNKNATLILNGGSNDVISSYMQYAGATATDEEIAEGVKAILDTVENNIIDSSSQANIIYVIPCSSVHLSEDELLALKNTYYDEKKSNLQSQGKTEEEASALALYFSEFSYNVLKTSYKIDDALKEYATTHTNLHIFYGGDGVLDGNHPEYTASDGSHLNTKGQVELAKELAIMIAGLTE